jgi:predicted nucleic acid-binding protein
MSGWCAGSNEDRIFLSVVSLAEIRCGVERLAPGRRHTRLDTWLREELPARFERRIVPVDGEVADACGHLLARARQAGRGLGAMDALIAAPCLARDLVLATRNLADFDGLGMALHAP